MNGHHHHDLDLVAALAGGWIDDGGERSTAERLIETCQACRDEFDLQTDVAGWLASAGAATMSEAERSMLRQGVDARLGARVEPQAGDGAGSQHGAEVVAMPERRAAATMRWLRLGSVAAALVVVVGVVGMLGGLGGDDDSGMDVAAEPFAGETAGDAGGGSGADAAAGDEAGVAGGDASEEEAATAMQADDGSAETMSAASDRLEAYGPGTAPVVTEPTDHTLAALADRVDAFVREVAAIRPSPVLTAEDFSAREAPTPECFTSDVEPAFAVLLTTLDGRPVQVFAVPGPEGEITASALRPDAGCEPVELP